MSGILVVTEHRHGEVSAITNEVIGAGLSMKKKVGGPLMVLVISDCPNTYANSLSYEGVDEIILARVGSDYFDSKIYGEVVLGEAQAHQPELILLGHTVNGMAFGPALATQLGGGFASDVFEIDCLEGEIVATRAIYEGKAFVEVSFPGACVTVMMLRAATFPAPEEMAQVSLSQSSLDLSEISADTNHIKYIEPPSAGIDIAKSEFIMSIGRGIQDEEHVSRFAVLADRMGATLGCSRPIADAAWLPKAHQVGLTGKVAASCNLYIALGISGAVQHLHGMKHVDTIIAVNTDANAPIFNVATYGVNMDIFELAEALERQFN